MLVMIYDQSSFGDIDTVVVLITVALTATAN